MIARGHAIVLLVAATALVGLAGCVSKTPFVCSDDSQCAADGLAGICESTGFCSFEDVECESGRRYGEAAGDGLADECVEGGVGCAGNLTITAGDNHSCAFDASGLMSCWGLDSSGQLGDDDLLRDHSSPRPVALLPPVAQMDAGRAHTCAVTRDNGLFCWGDNSDGQLGTEGLSHRLPVAVAADVAQVAAGGDTTCFVTTGGQVACLGDNASGELGIGSNSDQSSPVVVEGLDGVAQVDVGSSHSCALLLDGSVHCWGSNSTGQLGDGTLEPKLVPTAVPGVAGAVEIALGSAHSCARNAAGQVSCWGLNLSGQLADGTEIDRPDPTIVNNVVATQRILAAGSHTCAVGDGGALSCWGENGSGQIGDLTKDDRSAPFPVPVAVAGPESVAIGGGHSCAQGTDGNLQCWGSDVSGQLGIGAIMRSNVPIQVGGVTNATLVASGDGHSCAVLSSGGVQCWGEANDGELGYGSTSRSDSGAVDVENVVAADSIVAAFDRTCVHETGDTVSCWGGLLNGLLGAGSTSDRSTAGQINTTLVVSPTSVTVSSEHTCATTTLGEVFCWGLNSSGQLGNGSTSSTTTASASSAAVMPTVVAAGDGHSCAVDNLGATLCWGSGDNGELGDGTSTGTGAGAAVTVALTAPTALALGNNHSCAIASDQTVRCWGRNDQGQVGGGTDNLTEPTPVTVSGLSGVTNIDSDEDFSCARQGDGTVWCWGENDEGELGGGSTAPSHAEPIQVSDLNAIAIATGSDHACAVASDNTVWCWGDNSDAQLDGRQVRFLQPTVTVLQCQ